MIANMGYKQALTVFVGGSCVASYAFSALLRAGGEVPSSVNSKWAAATKEYMKSQDMNPIGLGGRRTYDPSYIKKE